MGFLKEKFQSLGFFREPSSFEHLSEDELETHMRIDRYGDFKLTDAVRPSYDLQVIPSQGYRHDVYRDEWSRRSVPVLMAAVTRRKLFEAFMDLLNPLGRTVNVVLETGHNRNSMGHKDLYREHMDLPVLKSILWDYEELLTHDGRTGIAVFNPATHEELQFEEHKLFIIYAQSLVRYQEILNTHQIPCRERIKFINEAEHVHFSSDTHETQFGELTIRLGLDDY